MYDEGREYLPARLPGPVVKPGEFVFAAVGMDHGHIGSMCDLLRGAGATLKCAYDPDPEKLAAFCRARPGVMPASCEAEILDDPEIRLVAGAAVPSDRAALGLRVMASGKDYFTDKAPLTTLEQLAAVRSAVAETRCKYMCDYSERLHSEAGAFATNLIRSGALGKIVQVLGLGPHRLNAASRPAWFFEKARYGGILCDIGSHQIEQYLHYTGVKEARVNFARVRNCANPAYPELEDFGEASLTGDDGSSNYFRVDWFSPDGLGTWGDGRTVILGTRGYLEMRKYINLGVSLDCDTVLWADANGEHRACVREKVGYPFFGELILDCLNRTENAMTQEHALKAAELCVKIQLAADGLGA